VLATGRRTLKRGSGASMTGAEAASVVGSYAASQLKRMFASKLPIDVLSIEAGQQGLADVSLEAGAYVSDKIYLGSVYRLGARPERNENAAGFRLEYQITPRWNLETEYGTARVGGRTSCGAGSTDGQASGPGRTNHRGVRWHKRPLPRLGHGAHRTERVPRRAPGARRALRRR
jgi:hypothetical protein